MYQFRKRSSTRTRPRHSLRAALAASALATGALLAALVNGCASQMVCESPTDPCVQTGGPAEAAVTAAAAGALWVGGGGCAIAGCRHPYVCNTGSGLCERPMCGEGQGPCPLGTHCDSLTATCY